MKIPTNLLVVFRIILGGLFVVSGFEKLISPHQNFLYVVQSYEVFPTLLEKMIVFVMPWFELVVGVFTILGLWLDFSLKGILILFCGFISIVGQALIRKLPISECGCFGELFSFPLHVVIIFDSVMFFVTLMLWLKLPQTSTFSVDQAFEKK